MNRAATAILALGLGAACGGDSGGGAPMTPPTSVVPPMPSTPPPPPEPVEVLTGVTVIAGPVERLRDPGWLRTTLDLRVSADAGTVGFDWFAPYAAGGDHSATFWTNVVDWRVEPVGSGATLHSLDIEWPADREVGLRFRLGIDIGDDRPSVLCNAAACVVTP